MKKFEKPEAEFVEIDKEIATQRVDTSNDTKI